MNTHLFEQFIEKLSYLLLHNAIEYYTDDRVMRMKDTNPNSDAEYEYIPFRAEEFQDLAWDYSLDIVKKIKNTEQNRQDVMRMLSEWQLQYSPDLAIVSAEDMVKAFNPPNRDVILDRIEKDKKQKSYDTAAQVVQEVVQALDNGYDPQMVAEIVYNVLNPQQQQLGDVQKKQQGLV
jgi:predicted NAD/FAD-dependent oxidoreductase